MVIRTANLKDFKDLQEIDACNRRNLDENYYQGDIVEILSLFNDLCFVKVSDDKVVGYILTVLYDNNFKLEEDGSDIVNDNNSDKGETGHTALIYSIAIDEAFRRKGIASELIEASLEGVRARKRGVKTSTFTCFTPIETVKLTVRASNTGAINLYKKFQFVETLTLQKYYPPPKEEDALLMQLVLE